MGIFDRLGDVLKSYLNDEDRRIFGRSRPSAPFGDPDLEAAYEELDEFLRHGSRGPRDGSGGPRGPSAGGRDWESPRQGSGRGDGAWESPRPDAARRHARRDAAPPEELRPDFAELDLPFGASSGDCKAAYKKLLNIHHPDRHAGNSGNMKRATEKSARINAAYDRIETWRKGAQG
jgi:hypothetical protein